MLKLVLIEWVDSGASFGWETDAFKHRDVKHCRSIGWLLEDGKHAKSITAHITLDDDPPHTHGVMTIPTGAITKMKTLTWQK